MIVTPQVKRRTGCCRPLIQRRRMIAFDARQYFQHLHQMRRARCEAGWAAAAGCLAARSASLPFMQQAAALFVKNERSSFSFKQGIDAVADQAHRLALVGQVRGQ